MIIHVSKQNQIRNQNMADIDEEYQAATDDRGRFHGLYGKPDQAYQVKQTDHGFELTEIEMDERDRKLIANDRFWDKVSKGLNDSFPRHGLEFDS